MRRLLTLVWIVLFAGGGCVFTVEHELKSGLEAEPGEDVIDDSGGGGGAPDIDDGSIELRLFYGEALLDDGERILSSSSGEEGRSLRYEIRCEADDGCILECRLKVNQGRGDWEPCLASGEVELEEEGHYRFEARRSLSGAGERGSQVIGQGVVYLVDFEISVLGLVATTGVAHRQVGEMLVECSREDCELTCQWESGDDIQRFNCPTDPAQREELVIPAAFASPDITAGLTVEGCASSIEGVHDHCRQFLHSFQLTDPMWTKITGGDSFACGILHDNSLWCWGRNNVGQLGLGTSESPKLTPQRVHGRYKQIAAGERHICAISLEDKLYCWGDRGLGKLGLGASTGDIRAPAQVGHKNWRAVAAGDSSSCAIDDKDELYCWGGNTWGQLGVGDRGDRQTPEKVSHPEGDEIGWAKVDIGKEHACAVDRGGRLYCWGSDQDARLGVTGAQDYHTTPQRVFGVLQGDQAVIDLSLGADFTCALRADHNLYCWGNDSSGQLGHGLPAQFPDTVVHTELVQVESKYLSSCGLRGDDRLYCWGENSSGQLGLGDIGSSSFEPYPTTVGEEFAAIALGRTSACGIRSTGQLFCWGRGAHGALGTGDLEDQLSPVPVHW